MHFPTHSLSANKLIVQFSDLFSKVGTCTKTVLCFFVVLFCFQPLNFHDGNNEQMNMLLAHMSKTVTVLSWLVQDGKAQLLCVIVISNSKWLLLWRGMTDLECISSVDMREQKLFFFFFWKFYVCYGAWDWVCLWLCLLWIVLKGEKEKHLTTSLSPIAR